MSVHISEATVDPQGRVVLDHLPFQPGERVDVIIRAHDMNSRIRMDLAGSVSRYDDPFEPVAWEDWEIQPSNSDRPRRSNKHFDHTRERFSLSIISSWEVAKLAQYGRLYLGRAVSEWIESALLRLDWNCCHLPRPE